MLWTSLRGPHGRSLLDTRDKNCSPLPPQTTLSRTSRTTPTLDLPCRCPRRTLRTARRLVLYIPHCIGSAERCSPPASCRKDTSHTLTPPAWKTSPQDRPHKRCSPLPSQTTPPRTSSTPPTLTLL
eukprot:783170-Rhodomonas_salina.1